MAYVRFGKTRTHGYSSDVYVYGSTKGYICCACRLSPGREWWNDTIVKTPLGMYNHLLRHRLHEHRVPDHPFDRLRGEMKPSIQKTLPAFETNREKRARLKFAWRTMRARARG